MKIIIERPSKNDIKSIHNVFEKTIINTFEKEGLSHLKDDIHNEIENKKQLLNKALTTNEKNVYYFVAKIKDEIIGTISFSPFNDVIKKFIDNKIKNVGELGSLYVLPNYQNKGVASALIQALIEFLHTNGIQLFCLDCGYKQAQKKWLRKFGTPYKIIKDYWGKDNDYMIWLCEVKDYIR